jgi:hypothetical protein
MATTTMPGPSEPGNPLPVLIELEASPAALRVFADTESGLVRIEWAAWSRAGISMAPEVALELALYLVSRANDLRQHGGRP